MSGPLKQRRRRDLMTEMSLAQVRVAEKRLERTLRGLTFVDDADQRDLELVRVGFIPERGARAVVILRKKS